MVPDGSAKPRGPPPTSVGQTRSASEPGAVGGLLRSPAFKEPTLPSTSTVHATAFATLISHLKQWFHAPDIEALEIAFAIGASHMAEGDPIWLFVVGPPATGKTSAIIQALRGHPKGYIVGDLTPQTLLSAKKRKDGQENSLLNRLGNPVLLIKDFTTIISKRPDDRLALISQFREVYDGVFAKDTGENGRLIWTGKATVIAACTPAIERQWAILRDLGERFMTVRWSRESGLHSGRRTLTQCGHESGIGLTTAKLGKEIFGLLPKDRPALTFAMEERIIGLAELVALSRSHITRDTPSREIISIDDAEGSARILKALRGTLVNYAALFNRECSGEDMRIAVRLAMDSIPHGRATVLTSIPCDAPMSFTDLQTTTKLPISTLQWHLDELEAIGLLVRIATALKVEYAYTNTLREVWRQSFPSTT